MHFPSSLFSQPQLMLCQRVTELSSPGWCCSTRQIFAKWCPAVVRNELREMLRYQGVVYVPLTLLHHWPNLERRFPYLMNDFGPTKRNTKYMATLRCQRVCLTGKDFVWESESCNCKWNKEVIKQWPPSSEHHRLGANQHGKARLLFSSMDHKDKRNINFNFCSLCIRRSS